MQFWDQTCPSFHFRVKIRNFQISYLRLTNLTWVSNFITLGICFIFGTQFSWNEGIYICFNVECVLLGRTKRCSTKLSLTTESRRMENGLAFKGLKLQGKMSKNWVSAPKIAFTILALHFTIMLACVVNIWYKIIFMNWFCYELIILIK